MAAAGVTTAVAAGAGAAREAIAVDAAAAEIAVDAAAGVGPAAAGAAGSAEVVAMLMPKRVKHRKQFRGRMRGNTKGGSTVAFGEYGIKAVERGWITNRQIEAARVAMTRKIERGGRSGSMLPRKPYTKKPAETRMGSARATPRAGSPWSSPAR